jgi:hypothetical protein
VIGEYAVYDAMAKVAETFGGLVKLLEDRNEIIARYNMKRDLDYPDVYSRIGAHEFLIESKNVFYYPLPNPPHKGEFFEQPPYHKPQPNPNDDEFGYTALQILRKAWTESKYPIRDSGHNERIDGRQTKVPDYVDVLNPHKVTHILIGTLPSINVKARKMLEDSDLDIEFGWAHHPITSTISNLELTKLFVDDFQDIQCTLSTREKLENVLTDIVRGHL